MTHRELCIIGANWLKNHKRWTFRKPYILIELCPIYGESPDVFGLDSYHNLLIEVKITKADFRNDLKKKYRQEGKGIGATRYYLCPSGVITIQELPDKWGLLYCDEKGKIEVIKESMQFTERDLGHEICIMQSVIRRLAGQKRILDFRKEAYEAK
jgi:hypothetical protein